MTGSLQIKQNKFYIVLNISANGKRKQKWIATGLPVKGNKRKAEQLLRDKLYEYELTPETVHSDVLFSDYIRIWLNTVRRRVDEVTFQGYEILAKCHVIPYFEGNGLKLSEISRDVLQAYVDEKANTGRKDGKGGLSPRSVRMHVNILRQTLNMAVKDRLLLSNPCQFVDLPKQERSSAKFYDGQQLQALFDAIREEPLYPLVKITCLYGLRRSEVLGLKWDSVDFRNGRITIQHTVSKVTKTVAKDKTKTAASFRSFPMMPEAEEIFRAAKAEESANLRLFGKDYQRNDYVFKWPDGHPFSPDYVTREFSKLLEKKGLPHIRFHELRHSCASLLLNSGFTLKDVQEWMGHSDIKMTANIYGHIDTARKQGMADLISERLGAR